MSPRSPDPLHPRMAALLQRIARAARPPFETMTPVAARAAYLAVAEVLDLPRAPLARVEDFNIASADGRLLPARLYCATAATEAPRPALLWMHGGGFVIGGLETHDSLCRQLAVRSGWAVVALDYRLAPEHRFPAAFDDAWAAMHALSHQPARYGIAAHPLAVGGDSAGGTLAAACALHARDTALTLALQLLVTPGTTAHADTPSHRRFAHGYLLDAETIAWMFAQTIDDAQRDDWRFAPLNAEVDGVAQACFVLAECDPLVDEGIAYADALRRAGVAVNLELVRGVTHDFIKLGRALPEAGAALDVCAAALRAAERAR